MCQAPLQFTLIAIILKGPLLNPGMTSAQGNQHGQVLGAAGCWKAPQDSLTVNFYHHASWFYGSSAEQTTLKEDRSSACFLEQLVEVQQDPTEIMKGIAQERLPFKDQGTLWPLP